MALVWSRTKNQQRDADGDPISLIRAPGSRSGLPGPVNSNFLGKVHPLALTIAAGLLLFSNVAAAQLDAAIVPEPAATEGATQPYPYPKMEPAATLTGRALLDALRKGGYVLYMRHTETGAVTLDCNASNLTSRGERDAARVGAALKSLAIPLKRIASSPVCRVRDSARNLGLGGFDLSEDLANVPVRPGFDLHAARGKLLATVPAKGSNTLLVSHMHAGNSIEQKIDLDFGEVIVFRPDGKVGSDAIARIRVDEWARLIKIDEPVARIAIFYETAAK